VKDPDSTEPVEISASSVIEEIQREISSMTELAEQPYRIIDSIPIPVCKFGRAKFHKTFHPHILLNQSYLKFYEFSYLP